MKAENEFKAWTKNELPKKILAIRLQAFGDSFISVACLHSLKQSLGPKTEIDFVTRVEFRELPQDLILFNKIYSIRGGNPLQFQFFWTFLLLPQLKLNKYDAVLDLQNNEVSNLIRKFIKPECYVRFDRFSSKHAWQRTLDTINMAGFAKINLDYDLKLKDQVKGLDLLFRAGWKKEEKLILINPAGFFTNRNWPLENYIQWMHLILSASKAPIRFLFLGTDRIAEKAKMMSSRLSEHCILMINKTSQSQALAIVQQVSLCLTEDGALMHMAYLTRVPTIAILGSSRSDWINPKLPHTFCFTSDDLECGNCMLDECKYKTNVCMTRVSPQTVFDRAKLMLNF